MNIERTIEFLLKNQARMDARFNAKFDRADERFEQAEKRFAQHEKHFAQHEKRFAQAEKRFAHEEKRLDRLEHLLAQNNRVVTRLTRYGVSLRSEVRRTERNLASFSEGMTQIEGKLAKLATQSSETEDKLNALIDFVDRHTRGNGRQRDLHEH